MATQIKVLLKADVPSLGTGGEVVRVRPGFARNYLLPRGVAVPATPNNLARVDELKKEAAARAKTELDEARALGEKLTGASVTVQRAVGEEGKMYGSVTSKDIEEAFAKTGITVDRKKVVLAEPLKQLGTFDVPVRLHPEVTATLKVTVAKK